MNMLQRVCRLILLGLDNRICSIFFAFLLVVVYHLQGSRGTLQANNNNAKKTKNGLEHGFLL